MAGVEEILSQNPYEPPTRRPKHTARPLFHEHSREERKRLQSEQRAFLADYDFASEALRSGRMEAIAWFPDGSYRPQLPFLGSPPPPCPPPPPTRRLAITDSGVVLRGPVPVIETGGWSGRPDHPT